MRAVARPRLLNSRVFNAHRLHMPMNVCVWNTLWIGKLIFSVWTFVIVRSTVHLEQIWKTIKLQFKCNGFILATKPITFYQFSCASNHVHNYNEPINISIITCCWWFFLRVKRHLFSPFFIWKFNWINNIFHFNCNLDSSRSVGWSCTTDARIQKNSHVHRHWMDAHIYSRMLGRICATQSRILQR